VTLVAGLTVNAGWLLYRRVLYNPAQSLLVDLAAQVMLASLYTAALAPPIHYSLLAMPGTLGLARPRYTYAGWKRMGQDLV